MIDTRKFISNFFDSNSNLYKFLNIQGFEYIQKNRKEFIGQWADFSARPSKTGLSGLGTQCWVRPMLSARVWPRV
jgi:hypothetical protein